MGAVESSTTRYQGTPPSGSTWLFADADGHDARWFDVDNSGSDFSGSGNRNKRRVAHYGSFNSSGDECEFHSVSGDSIASAESYQTADDTPASFVSARSRLSGGVGRSQSKHKRSRSSRAKQHKLSVSFHGLSPNTGTPRTTADESASAIEIVLDDEIYGSPSPRKLRFSLADGSLTKERLEALSHEVEKASNREQQRQRNIPETQVNDDKEDSAEANAKSNIAGSPEIATDGVDEGDFIDANFSVPHRGRNKSDRSSSKRRRGRSSIGVKLANLAGDGGDCAQHNTPLKQCGCDNEQVATFDSFDELNNLIRRGIDALEGLSADDAVPAVSLDANDLRRLLLLAGNTRERIQKKTKTSDEGNECSTAIVDSTASSVSQLQTPKDSQLEVGHAAVITAQPVTRYRATTMSTAPAAPTTAATATPRSVNRTPKDSRTPRRHRYKDTSTYIETFSVDPEYWASPRPTGLNRQGDRPPTTTSSNIPRQSGRGSAAKVVDKENRSPQKLERRNAEKRGGVVKPKHITYSTPVATGMTTRSKRKLQPPTAIDSAPTSPTTTVAVELWGTPYIATTIRAKRK